MSVDGNSSIYLILMYSIYLFFSKLTKLESLLSLIIRAQSMNL